MPGTLKQGEASDKTGTTIRFWADPDIFETTTYDFETVARRLQEMAFLNKGLTINLTDERVTPEEVVDEVVSDTAEAPKSAEEKAAEQAAAPHKVKHRTFHYPGGLVDFVKHINRTKQPIHSSVVDFSGKGEGHEVEVAMQWNAGYSESVHTFANTINTHEGGTHEEGFRAALTTVVNKYAKDKKLLKDKDPNLTGDDIREGLAAVISVKVAQPQFEGQTKTKLGNTEVKSFVQKDLQRAARPLVRGQPVGRQDGRQQGGVLRAGPHRRAQGSRAGAPQERHRHRRPARQARRLPLHRPEQVGTVCGGG